MISVVLNLRRILCLRMWLVSVQEELENNVLPALVECSVDPFD